MKKVVFVISHRGSGSEILCKMLDSHPKIQFCSPGLWYNHPSVLGSLTAIHHKVDNVSAVWLDQLLYNNTLSHKVIYKLANFIYFIREPRGVFNGDIPYNWFLNYIFRLRRICEMARQTPGAVLLTYNDLVRGLGADLIQQYLKLKEKPIFTNFVDKPKKVLVSEYAEVVQESYERHYRYLRHLNLLRYSVPSEL